MSRARAVVCLVLFLCWICRAAAAQPSPSPDWNALEETARAEIAEVGAPGGAVVVVSGDRVVWSKGFGLVGHAVPEGGKPAVVRPMADDTRIWPAGYAYASADDLSRFVIALLNDGRVDGRQALPAGVTARMLAPHIAIPTNVFTEGHYGYGLILQNRGGLRVAEHGGQLTGYSTEIRLVPERRLAVITLANREGVRLEKTFGKVFEMMLGARPSPPAPPKPALPMGDAEMRRLAGSYDNRWKMDVFVRDGQLFLRRFGAELPITKVGEDRYAVRPEGLPQPQEFLYLPAKDGGPGALQMFIWVFRRVN